MGGEVSLRTPAALEKLSIVVPCYNEEANVEALVKRVASAARACVPRYEIVLVDDGSRDDTLHIITRLAGERDDVRALGLSRNFGKEAAMLAGLTAAVGDAVVIMDADLQHPPELLEALVDGYRRGFDQVIAKRDRSGEGRARAFLSRRYYRLVQSLMDVRLEDGAGDFRLLSRRALDALLTLSERNRFSKGLFAWIGFPTTAVDFSHVDRAAGESSWSFTALLNYGIDGVVSFNSKPLRTAIWLGLGALSLFVLYVIVLIVAWFSHGVELPGYITTIATIVGVGGIQFVFMGIVGEYVGRIYVETKQRPHYLLQVDTGEPGADE